MLFSSYEFIFLFLPLVFFGYFYLLSKRLATGAKSFIVVASLFFYGWWNMAYLPLILLSMLFNYTIGTSLSRKKESRKAPAKTLLLVGIVGNLGLLGYFKYADFFIDNMNFLFQSNIGQLNLLLPLAISFFTFQQIAYLVDSYKHDAKEYDFLNYAVFVTFFPQLIAGPIVHHKEMMPQFASRWNLVKRYKNIAMGMFIFSIGLFKKVVIADTFAEWATAGFDKAETLNLIEAWATSLSYTFQLYFDFSGYTDMAIGAALLFNIRLPINFNSPYKALSIQDFWRRWHITLSRFLRDYIYIPLGGNRSSEAKTYANLMVTFLIGGLWHGAAWTFVFWGFLHGLALVIHRAWQRFGGALHPVLAWFITFNFVNVTWVFFRATSWEDALKVIKGMVGLQGVVLPEKYFKFLSTLEGKWFEFGTVYENINGKGKTTVFVLVGLFVVLYFKNSNFKLQEFKPTYLNLTFTLVLFIMATSMMSRVSEFLYFNF